MQPATRREAVERIKAFCKEASNKLGYTGNQPVEFWEGTILRYLETHRPDNKYIRLGIPLTIFSADFSQLSQDFCKFLQENSAEPFMYKEPTIQ